MKQLIDGDLVLDMEPLNNLMYEIKEYSSELNKISQDVQMLE